MASPKSLMHTNTHQLRLLTWVQTQKYRTLDEYKNDQMQAYGAPFSQPHSIFMQ